MLGEADIPFKADGIRLRRYLAIEYRMREPQYDRHVQQLHRQPQDTLPDRLEHYPRIERGELA
ncbi:MAG: hypothetical protein AAF416_13980 [Pseudomonadota bacterium]